jgi:DNA-binding transcriptional MerR regulator
MEPSSWPDLDAEAASVSGPQPAPPRPEGSPSPAAPQPQYSIAAVSKLTGISCHTLRVWERRYGFPIPVRSPAGHRRYDGLQVQQLRRLTHVQRAGKDPISKLVASLRGWKHDAPEAPPRCEISHTDEVLSELIGRLIAGDQMGADQEYDRLASRFDPSTLVERVIEAALVEAGEGCFRHTYSAYQERLITVYMRRKLAGLIEATCRLNQRPNRCVIAGTVQGDRHEGGVLILNFLLESSGWQVHNMGVDLPVSEYRKAVADLHPSALALSFILSRNIRKRFHDLEPIQSVPVFVGGRSIVNYQALARSHGLIPITGSMRAAVVQLQDEFDRWCRRHGVLS